MLDRWSRWCRRLVPEPLRVVAFDPAVADLQADWTERADGRRAGFARVAGRARLAVRLLTTALECRRLGTSPASEQGVPVMWLHEIQQSLRAVMRRPGPSAIAVLTLAMGIGANLTVFSVANTFLLAPVHVPLPEGLVRVYGTTPSHEWDVVSYPTYRDARDMSPRVDLAAHAQPMARVGTADSIENRAVELVSGNYFRVLGLTAAAGRLIEERDDVVEGASPVVVLSETFWRSRFGASPSAVGQRLHINGNPFEIIGVIPAGFRGTYNAHAIDVWAPLAMQQQVGSQGLSREIRNWGWLSMIGRVRPDSSINDVARDLARAAADIDRRFPPRDGIAFGFVVNPALAVAAGERDAFTPFLGIVFAFTVLLFIVTCANLAGVMHVRLLARQREIAIRQSLGAGRGRLVFAWLSECLVLSIAGGLVGLAISRGLASIISQIPLPAQLVGDLTLHTSLDWRVWTYTLGVSMVAAVLFGLGPAMRAGRRAPLDLLKDEGGTVTGGRRGQRLRRSAVFVQVAVSIVLLVAAGLLATSVTAQRGFDPGFRTSELGLMTFNLRQGSTPIAPADAARQLLGRIRAEPGVSGADLATNVPLGFGKDRLRFRIPGYVMPDGSTNLSIDFNTVGASYLTTLGVPFLAGASWTPGAVASTAPPVVINDTMARRFWKDGQAVGQPIEIVGIAMGRVAGVVRDIAYYDVGAPPIPYVYLPAELRLPGKFTVHVRTIGPPTPVLKRLERAVTALDTRFAPSEVMTFDELRAVPLFPARMLLAAAGAFGALALVLTGMGLYGVVSASVAQRTREIGVRMALGARPADVFTGVLREAGLVVGLGALGGFLGAYYVAQALGRAFTFTATFDPLVALSVAVGLALLAVTASWLPARRAARVDPVTALRQ